MKTNCIVDGEELELGGIQVPDKIVLTSNKWVQRYVSRGSRSGVLLLLTSISKGV